MPEVKTEVGSVTNEGIQQYYITKIEELQVTLANFSHFKISSSGVHSQSINQLLVSLHLVDSF